MKRNLRKTLFSLTVYLFVLGRLSYTYDVPERILWEQAKNRKDTKDLEKIIEKKIDEKFKEDSESDFYYKKMYKTAYSYFIENYGLELNQKDLTYILETIDENLLANKRKYPLFFDCVNSIEKKKDNLFEGNIKLAILQDILKEEDLIYLILTNQEEQILPKIYKKLEIKDEEEQEKFLEQLETINKENVENATLKEYMLFNNNCRTKQKIFHKYYQNHSNSTIIFPNWSIFSNNDTGYQILVTNQYLKNFPINIRALSQEETLEERIEKEFVKNGKEQWHQLLTKQDNSTIALLSFLNKDIVEKQQEETEEEYLKRIQNSFEIDIFQFALGMKQGSLSSFKIYMEQYFKNLAKKEISIEDIYDFIYIQDTIFNKLNNIKEETEFVHSTKNQMINIIVANKKEELCWMLDCVNLKYDFYNPLTKEEEKNIKNLVLIKKINQKEEEGYEIHYLPKDIDLTSLDVSNNSTKKIPFEIEYVDDKIICKTPKKYEVYIFKFDLKETRKQEQNISLNRKRY